MQKQNLKSFILGGIIPVILFTWVEDKYGTLWGLIVGMLFGAGEIFWEWKTLKRVEAITLGANGMLIVLGGVSLLTQEGIWFKLQPAIMEGAFSAILWGSVWMGKPLLFTLMKKQYGVSIAKQSAPLGASQFGPPEMTFWDSPPGLTLRNALSGLTFRLGVFFALHSALATWAALEWSTASWAILKGLGFTGSLIVYFLVESLILRYRLAIHRK